MTFLFCRLIFVLSSCPTKLPECIKACITVFIVYTWLRVGGGGREWSVMVVDCQGRQRVHNGHYARDLKHGAIALRDFLFRNRVLYYNTTSNYNNYKKANIYIDNRSQYRSLTRLENKNMPLFNIFSLPNPIFPPSKSFLLYGCNHLHQNNTKRWNIPKDTHFHYKLVMLVLLKYFHPYQFFHKQYQ